MVVKLIEAEDIDLLEERINMFIVEKDKTFIKENPDCPKLKFNIDLKVVPGYDKHDEYFIAVIQY